MTPQDLRSISLFSAFGDSELEPLLEHVQVRNYPAHEQVFTSGEISRGIWLVRSGRLRIYRIGPYGDELTMRIAEPGKFECLGMCPLFSRHECTSNAETLEPTRLYFIDGADALALGKHRIAFAGMMALVLSKNYRYLAGRSTGLALDCSTPRLADLLLNFASELGSSTEQGVELDLPVDRQVLATLVGTTTQTIHKNLQKMQQAGVVAVRRKHLVIRNPERLSGMD
ncbi:MAG: Crp/Fnr family transcriptional regulator [Rudaea sp.]